MKRSSYLLMLVPLALVGYAQEPTTVTTTTTTEEVTTTVARSRGTGDETSATGSR